MRSPDWLDEDAGEAPGPRRPTWLIAAAIAPWFLVVGVLISGTDDLPLSSPDSDSAREAAPEAGGHVTAADTASSADPRAPGPDLTDLAPAVPDPATPGTAASPPSPPQPTHEPEASWIDVRHLTPEGDVRDDAAALALVVTGTWLANEEVTHLVTETVQRTSERSIVATVLALIESQGPVGALRRIAVPLAITDGGLAPTATPYAVPPPDTAPVDPPLHAVEDPELVTRVVEALGNAGLADLDVEGLYTADGWPLLADVRGPDGEVRPTVWLVYEDDGVVVAGAHGTTVDESESESPPVDVRGDGEVAR